ncbi:MAG: hypothetical protein WC762_08590 [Methylobacter sp.]|jgi:hypothetical protein
MKTLCRILLLSLLAMSTTSIAARSTVSTQTFSAYTKLTQAKLDAATSNSQKDIQIVQSRIDNQDKRLDNQDKFIGAQESRIGDISFYLTAFGFLLTTILALLALIIFFTVRSRARAEARISAEKWYAKKTGDLEQQIQSFRERLSQQEQQFNAQIKTQAKNRRTASNNTSTEIIAETLPENAAPKSSPSIPLNITEDEALSNLAENLFGKTESENWNSKGFDLLILAKEAWEETDLRTDYLTEAAACFETAQENASESDISLIMSNQAYTAALQGQTEGQVRPLLRKALSMGGEALYNGMLKTLEINPVPSDAIFRTLLDSAWNEAKQTGWLGFTSMGRRNP